MSMGSQKKIDSYRVAFPVAIRSLESGDVLDRAHSGIQFGVPFHQLTMRRTSASSLQMPHTRIHYTHQKPFAKEPPYGEPYAQWR